MKNCIVTRVGNYAIGDSIYTNVSMRYLSERYHKIFTWHTLPSLFSNIKNIQWIDPSTFSDSVFDQKRALQSLWMRYAHEDISAMVEPMIVSYDDQIDVFTYLANGECFRSKGYYYPEKTISGPVSEWVHSSDRKHKLFTPEPSGEMVENARLWMIHHGIDFSKPVIFFHSTWRNVHQTQLQSRSALDEDARKVFDLIKKKINPCFVDAEVALPNLISPLREIPAFPLGGVNGIKYTKAVISLCDGVVLQGSNRLLPISQSCDIPIMCMNRGGHKLSVLNWPRFDHDPFIEVEPEVIHECNPCGICDECSGVLISESVLSSRSDQFLELVSSRYSERIKMKAKTSQRHLTATQMDTIKTPTSPKKLFILSMPRSGSTITRQVLVDSGKVAMPHGAPDTFFSNLANAYYNARAWSVEHRKELEAWTGEDDYNEDIKLVNPARSRHNIGPCIRMSKIADPTRAIIDHVMNPTSLQCFDFVGVKAVNDFRYFVLVWRMIRDLYAFSEFRIIINIRHPFRQIRSMCNAPWNCNRIQSNNQAIDAFWERLEWWKTFTSTVYHEHRIAPDSVFLLFYEDMASACQSMAKWAGLEWNDLMNERLNGPPINPSPVKFPLSEECFQAAHEAYMNCELVKNGYGPGCLDNILDLVKFQQV